MRPRLLTMHPVPAPRPPPRKSYRATVPSIPLASRDLEEIIPSAIVHASESANDTEPLLRALSTQQATVIVDGTEEEVRARVEAEIVAIVRKALASMTPPPPRTDHGASIRWLLVGLVTGAIVVYVLMAGALYDREVALAQARMPGGPPPVYTAAPVVLSAPPAETCSATSSAIPTVDVENLPRHTTAPQKRTSPPKKSNVDEDNPYADVSPE